jgi:hypothetical protein
MDTNYSDALFNELEHHHPVLLFLSGWSGLSRRVHFPFEYEHHGSELMRHLTWNE